MGEGDAGVTPGSVYAGENNKEALRAAQKRYVLGLSQIPTLFAHTRLQLHSTTHYPTFANPTA